MTTIFLLVTLILLSVPDSSKVAGYITACYFTSWSAQTSLTKVRLPVKEIDPYLCTHLIYAFAKLDVESKSVVAIDPVNEYSRNGVWGNYKKFNHLKSKNPNLKTLLSVGGETPGIAEDFSSLAATPESLQQFANNTIRFLREHGFDGLDVDWEYPYTSTKSRFTNFLKTLRNEFDNEAKDREPLLLTIAAAAGVDKISAGYDVAAINKYVDYIFVMTFDFYGTWSRVTGFNSPLRAKKHIHFSPAYNVEYAVNVWITRGADRSKVIMGMTAAGASFTLSNKNNHTVGAPVKVGGGRPGILYKRRGRLLLPEICLSFRTGWTRVWDDEQQVPYAYKGDQWVGYDDQYSFGLKLDYAMEQQLGGVMFWELSFDDPNNYCKNGSYPLLNVVKSKFSDGPTDTSTRKTLHKDPVDSYQLGPRKSSHAESFPLRTWDRSPVKASPPRTQVKNPVKTSPSKTKIEAPPRSPPSRTRMRGPVDISPPITQVRSPVKASPPKIRMEGPPMAPPSRRIVRGPTEALPPRTRVRQPSREMSLARGVIDQYMATIQKASSRTKSATSPRPSWMTPSRNSEAKRKWETPNTGRLGTTLLRNWDIFFTTKMPQTIDAADETLTSQASFKSTDEVETTPSSSGEITFAKIGERLLQSYLAT
ncbi:chitinase-3-like protein 1 [Haliotis asinina]|uniref:chitinase-3-like protein 1 n=1 Tax=Haliotis asinina TaxID=109174 RepID=UPI003532146A